jgi:hypothetical protein
VASSGFVCADFVVAALLYLIFLAWYEGWPRRKLSPAEVETHFAKMKAQRAPQGEMALAMLERFRAFAASDDGGEFHMVNLLRWSRADVNSEAHKRYMRAWSKVAVPRASHPIYRGKVAGKVQGNLEDRLWDDVALMRYRSRRDLMKIVTDEAFMREAGQKGVAVEYTDAYPATPVILLGSPRVLVFLALLVIALALAVVLG